MDGLLGIVIGILLLSLMMFLHELGHYVVGKKLGFKILEFNIFMGPVLFSFYRNGVKYSLRLVPIGASVQFAGEGEMGVDADTPRASWAPEVETPSGKITSAWGEYNSKVLSGDDDPRLFYNRPKRSRAAVLLAGPFMNILSAFLAFIIIFNSLGYVLPVISKLSSDGQAVHAGLKVGDTIIELNGSSIRNHMDWNYAYLFIKPGEKTPVKYLDANGVEHESVFEPQAIQKKMLGIVRENLNAGAVRVVGVDPESNNGQPVLRAGDIILQVNGQDVNNENVSSVIDQASDNNIQLRILRGDAELELVTLAKVKPAFNSVGLSFTQKFDFLGSIPYAVNFSVSILKLTFSSIGQLIAGQIKAQDALSGPVGIVDTISGVVTQNKVDAMDKFMQLLQLFALISLSLGIMNLLPIPLLDGSHLLLIIVEAIRGKKLSMKAQTAISMIGLIIIFGLFAIGLYFDITRILSR